MVDYNLAFEGATIDEILSRGTRTEDVMIIRSLSAKSSKLNSNITFHACKNGEAYDSLATTVVFENTIYNDNKGE